MKIAKHKPGLLLLYSGPFFAFKSSTVMGSDWAAVIQLDSDDRNYDTSTSAAFLFMPHKNKPYESALSTSAELWLTENIGPKKEMWDCNENPFDLLFGAIYFKYRRDALKLVRYIQNIC